MELECKNCHITLKKDEVELKYKNKCPMCGKSNTFIDEYVMDIKRISTEESFVNAMIKLHDEDPIEYQLKLQQLKNAKEQEKQRSKEKNSENTNQPKCPTCNSSNIEKISLSKKAVSAALFGLFSSDIRKTMHCKNCGYKW